MSILNVFGGIGEMVFNCYSTKDLEEKFGVVSGVLDVRGGIELSSDWGKGILGIFDRYVDGSEQMFGFRRGSEIISNMWFEEFVLLGRVRRNCAEGYVCATGGFMKFGDGLPNPKGSVEFYGVECGKKALINFNGSDVFYDVLGVGDDVRFKGLADKVFEEVRGELKRIRE